MKKGKSHKGEQRSKSKQTSNKRERGIEGFPFPSQIIELRIRRNLSIKEAYFLMCLLDAMNKKNRTCWKSEKTLAAEMGCSRATIALIRNSLEEKEIIEVGKREKWHGHFALNEYRILYPWISPCIPDGHGPCLKSGQGTLSDFNKPPCLKSGHKSIKGNESISQSVKGKNTDSTKTSSLTDLTPMISREKTKKPLSLPKTGVRRVSRRARDEGLLMFDLWSEVYQARRAAMEKIEEENKKRVLEDFKAGKFDFATFCAPYKDRADLDTPQLSYQEELIEKFWEQMVDRFWNKKHPIKGGVKRLFFRACRDGAALEFGLTL